MQYVLDDSEPLMRLVQHPTLRVGSMIVWDQRTFHGSTPNLTGTFRAAVPIKAFSAHALREDPRRARERAFTILSELQKVGFLDGELTVLDGRVFGFDVASRKLYPNNYDMNNEDLYCN